MADIHSIDKKRQADRAVALLGLHAAEEAVSSACLTDEDLAALVGQQCSADKPDKALGHLASCPSCYRRWLELSEIIAGGVGAATQTKNKIHPLLQAKQLAWAGSLLAAAASVVLFINISGDRDGTMLQSQVQSTVELSKAPVPEIQGDKEQGVFGDSGQTRPSARAGRLDTVGQNMEMPAAAAPVMEEMQAEHMRAPAKRKTRAASQKSLQMQRPVPDGLVGGIDAWLAGLQQGCRQNNENRQFWNRKYMEGVHRVQPESAEQENLLNDLQPLLQRLVRSTGPVADICSRITVRIDAAADH